MPVQLHSVDGYKYTHGKMLSGWIEFPHPTSPGLLIRVQILVDGQGSTVLHDILNRPVVLNDTFASVERRPSAAVRSERNDEVS